MAKSRSYFLSASKKLITAILLSTFCALFSLNSAQAFNITILTESPQQGSMIIGQKSGEGKVYFDGRVLKTDPEGTFVFGVGRDAPETIYVTYQLGKDTTQFPVKIKKRKYKIERVDGLPPSKVSPKSPEVLARIAKEANQVRAARNRFSDLTDFKMPFILPAKGRISGVYGSQRILNGEPKRPHFGLDVANVTGTPIIAPIDGVVSLVHQDMFYSGGTLIIDHGFGISSTYIHLNTIDVTVGQEIKQGQQIGTIGSSGRATGPHLDWRLNWFQVRLDPQLLLSD